MFVMEVLIAKLCLRKCQAQNLPDFRQGRKATFSQRNLKVKCGGSMAIAEI